MSLIFTFGGCFELQQAHTHVIHCTLTMWFTINYCCLSFSLLVIVLSWNKHARLWSFKKYYAFQDTYNMHISYFIVLYCSYSCPLNMKIKTLHTKIKCYILSCLNPMHTEANSKWCHHTQIVSRAPWDCSRLIKSLLQSCRTHFWGVNGTEI